MTSSIGDYGVVIEEGTGGIGDYGVLIEDETDNRDEGIDYSRYVFGTTGGSFSYGSGSRREDASLLLGFEIPFDAGKGRVYVSGYHYYGALSIRARTPAIRAG